MEAEDDHPVHIHGVEGTPLTARIRALEGDMAAFFGACELAYAKALLDDKPFVCSDIEEPYSLGYDMEAEILSLGDADNDGNDDGCTITLRFRDSDATLTDTWENNY